MVSILTSCTEVRWWLQVAMRVTSWSPLASMIPIITTRLIWPEITRDNHDDTARSRMTGAGCWWLLMVPDVDMETLVVFAAPWQRYIYKSMGPWHVLGSHSGSSLLPPSFSAEQQRCPSQRRYSMYLVLYFVFALINPVDNFRKIDIRKILISAQVGLFCVSVWDFACWTF